MSESCKFAKKAQPYKYGGKELDRVHGLNMYDYGARQYDPLLIGWDRMDPLCEKYYHLSPYSYCNNNPVRYIDKEGKKVWLYATTLPGSDNWLSKPITHTFIVVTGANGRVRGYYAYGSEYDGFESVPRPWTAEEQKAAVENEIKIMEWNKILNQTKFE